MRNVGRKLAFVLAATNHGMMITNRFDYRMSGRSGGGLANDGIGGGRATSPEVMAASPEVVAAGVMTPSSTGSTVSAAISSRPPPSIR